MFIAKKFRQLAEEYGSLANLSDKAREITRFRQLQKSNTTSAENEERLHGIYESTPRPDAESKMSGIDFAKEEEHVLRCLGAAVLMQWTALPTELQRELFDKAGAMAELQSTAALRGQIARFLHRHKDSENSDDTPAG